MCTKFTKFSTSSAVQHRARRLIVPVRQRVAARRLPLGGQVATDGGPSALDLARVEGPAHDEVAALPEAAQLVGSPVQDCRIEGSTCTR